MIQKKIRFGIFLITGLLLTYAGFSYSADKNESNKSSVKEETCRECHNEHYSSYKKRIHGNLIDKKADVNACETCHSNSVEHIQAGGGKGSGIFNFSKNIEAKVRDAKCLSCHKNTAHIANWNMSKHKSADLSCSDCHTIHSNNKNNLKMAEKDLCFSCHKDIKSQANKQSHHPIKEGKIFCSDCHSAHGNFGPKMIKTSTVNELCLNCHADKRGPFLFEHPPVGENCLTCHEPHASNHNKLMSKRMPNICQECHEWTGHEETPYTANFGFDGNASVSGKNKFIVRSCLNCHTNIHGSNAVGRRGPKFTR